VTRPSGANERRKPLDDFSKKDSSFGRLKERRKMPRGVPAESKKKGRPLVQRRGGGGPCSYYVGGAMRKGGDVGPVQIVEGEQ